MTATDDISTRADEPAPSAIVRETHTSYVLLFGDVAYKMKKSIRTDFLDFSTADQRRTACTREFTLNSRFAPDVYIGIADLSDPAGGPAEALLKMQRLPDSTKLSTMALDGRDLTAELQVISRIVASVHADSPNRPSIQKQGTSGSLKRRWHNNFVELRELNTNIVPKVTIDALERSSFRFIIGRDPLFANRISRGRIVDGHGDLLADDIFCLTDGPRILDCLDFDYRLCYIDGIDYAAEQFLTDYTEAAHDDPPRSLIDHYIAYRAVVRAKVACIRFRQGDNESRDDACRHIDMALSHSRQSTVTMTLVGGLPGTGKSTLSLAVGEETGAVVLSSDVVRKHLAGIHSLDARPADVDQGLYTPVSTRCTYTEMLRRAAEHLGMGRSVVLDASWNDVEKREEARAVAAAAHAQLVEIECTVTRRVALDRIGRRVHGASDATSKIYHVMSQRRAPWPQAGVVVDTSAPTTASTAIVVERIRHRQAQDCV
ncbi:AAA family ATPase [Rhodococcus sp. 15-1154-1]|nr:bifunctional aminoglycoside phosphotransferase/ATP-binding protein [Rhodococcus sp. 15-1154-1]OZF06437.1 AAA family ATPase [Rhodococcus sp. 15-1154-1]